MVPDQTRGATPPAELMSITNGQPAAIDTFEPTISGDGQVVAFGPAFFRDRATPNQAQLVAPAGSPVATAVSRGGCRIAFATAVDSISIAGAPQRISGGLHVFDRCAGTLIGSWQVPTAQPFRDVAISDGGRYVAATGRSAAGVFVVRLDTADGSSVQLPGAWQPAMGDEALTGVVAVSFSPNQGPVSLWDPASGALTPVSLPDTVSDPAAAQMAFQPSMTPDGRYVAFVSSANTLTPQGSAGYEIFVRDVVNQRTALVSKNAGGFPVKGSSAMPSISADGTQIAFGTEAQDLLAPPVPGSYTPPRIENVQLLVARTTAGWFDSVAFDRVSVLPDGSPIPSNDFRSTLSQPVISSSGRWVAFVSSHYDLLVGNDPRDVPRVDTWVIGRPPAATVSALDFGQIPVGTSAKLSATVTNTGISSILPAAFTASAGFKVVAGGTCQVNRWLSPGASCTVAVSYSATQAGDRSGTLTVAEAGYAAYSVAGSLHGFGVARATTTTTSTTTTTVPIVISLGIDPNPADSGSAGVGASAAPVALTVTNTGNGPAVIDSLAVGGANAAEFVISADGCSGVTLTAGGACPVSVVFTPTDIGPRTAELAAAAGSVSASATLTGTGLAIPVVRLLPNVFARGEVTIAAGVGFAAGQTVELHWDGQPRVFSAVADPSGVISVQIDVDGNAPLGPARLLVADVPGRYSGVFAPGLVRENSVRPPTGNNPGSALYQVLIIRG